MSARLFLASLRLRPFPRFGRAVPGPSARMRIIVFDICPVYEPGTTDLDCTEPLALDEQPDRLSC